jgi:hypothetical protein
MYQFDAHTIADLETFVAPLEATFGRRSPDPDPGALFRGARDDGIETLANP